MSSGRYIVLGYGFVCIPEKKKKRKPEKLMRFDEVKKKITTPISKAQPYYLSLSRCLGCRTGPRNKSEHNVHNVDINKGTPGSL